MDMFRRMKDIVAKNKEAIAILLIAAILRLFRFTEFVTFLGDQGRDAIIIKRIVTLEHLPAIGPSSSVGGVFLGPFFYYLISPFLLIFNFNPVGLAFSSAVFSITGMGVSYFIVKKELNKIAACVFLLFITFSAVHIDFARTSWNPNLLPITAFLTLFFWHRTTQTKHYIYPILTGIFASISFQLHYLSLLLLMALFLFWLYELVVSKARSELIFKTAAIVGTFIVVVSPLILFDIKNNFLNLRNFISTLTDNEFVSSSSPLYRIIETNAALYKHVFKINLNNYLALVFTGTVSILALTSSKFRKNKFLVMNLFFWLFFVVGFGYLNSFRYAHYFTPVYYSFFLIVAYVLTSLRWPVYIRAGLTIITLGILVFYNSQEYYFFKNSGSNQINIAQKVAQSLLDHRPKEPYQIVPIPFTETDGHIRYFLEIGGKKPLPEESTDEPEELYILCYQDDCSELAHPQWQIASFKNATIGDQWKVDRLIIYKVVHGK